VLHLRRNSSPCPCEEKIPQNWAPKQGIPTGIRYEKSPLTPLSVILTSILLGWDSRTIGKMNHQGSTRLYMLAAKGNAEH